MIKELERLLAQAGYQWPTGRDLRECLLMKRNAGSVPVDMKRPSEYVERGFQLVLLDRRGRPSHHARVRWAGDDLFARECAYVTALSADQELVSLIPRFKTACSSTLRVLVSEYLDGRTHLDRLPHESASAWLRTASAAVDLRDRLSERAGVVLPSLSEQLVIETPSQVASKRLDLLLQAGIPVQDVEALSSVTGPLDGSPRRIQHGDFWPGNLIRHRKSWWLIDYEEFGTVFTPLYDLFHFLQSTARAKGWGPSGGWLGSETGAMPRAWRRAFRLLLDRQVVSRGLSHSQVVAALAFYVIRMGSHRLRPGVPKRFAEPLLSDARTVARWVRESGPVERLFSWNDHA